ncbi:probable carboxylesterase 18 [Ricinus communis]|nr:probable carboxylesterase 18 [Ricinus communis]
MSSKSLPWRIRVPLFIFSTAVAACCRKNYTINRRIWNFFDAKSPPSETPRDGVKTSDIIIDATRNLWLRLYIPTSTTTMPVVIYMHGGGFSFFTADTMACEISCRRLASELNAIIISISYRLAPEFKFPCQYEDCFDALKFIDANLGDILPPFADQNMCFLIGDSAGRNLIHHTAVKASGSGFLRLKVIGLISIQPFFGGEERTESETRLAGAPVLNVELTDWFWKAFLSDGSDRDHPLCNVFGPNSNDISDVNLPAMLLVIGGFDILQDWQRKYHEWMRKAGKEVNLVEFPNAFHGFWGFPDLPEYPLFIEEVKDFMQKQSAK